MRVSIISDIHFDVWNYVLSLPQKRRRADMQELFTQFEAVVMDAFLNVDLVIVAGDAGEGTDGLESILRVLGSIPMEWRPKNVVYVPGNHEHYGTRFPQCTAALKMLSAGTIVTVMDRDTLDIGDFRILGTTLWTDFEVSGDPVFAKLSVPQRIADYKQITSSVFMGSRITPNETIHEHHISSDWLVSESDRARADGKRIVVVTHHPPVREARNPKFRPDNMECAFVSDRPDMVERIDAELWVAGHTHYDFDLIVGRTRMVSNQIGYPGEVVMRSVKFDLEEEPPHQQTSGSQDEQA